MASVAFHGSAINSVTASGHVPIRKWVPSYCNEWDEEGNCIGWGGGYYNYSTASATINGTVNQTSGNVYVNGKRVARNGSSTTETDSDNIPSGWSKYGGDNGGTGSVTSGNNRRVYANGSSIAVAGSSVRTHASVSTSIKNGSNNVHIG